MVVGTPDLTARRVIEQARRAEALGAAAVVVTAPLYALNDAAEIAEHFRMIARAVEVPLIAYDVPVRVHSKLGVDHARPAGPRGRHRRGQGLLR